MPVSTLFYFCIYIFTLLPESYLDKHQTARNNPELNKDIIRKDSNLKSDPYTIHNKAFTDKIDSLKQYLIDSTTTYEGNIICEIGSKQYRNFNFNQGLECAIIAYKIGTSLNDTSIIIRALRLFADNYYAMAEYEKSTEYFLKELEYHNFTSNTLKIAEIYCNIGVNFEERGLMEKGLFYYLEALKIYEEIDDKVGIVASLCNLSFVYRNQGNNWEAIQVLEKANEIENQYILASDLRKEHYYMANIADAYINLGEHQKAIQYLVKGEEILKDIPIPDDEDLNIWIDISKLQGKLYYEQGNIQKAILKYEEALKLSKKTGYPEKEGKAIVAYGKMLMKSGKNKKAEEILLEGLSIAKQTQSFYLLKDIYWALSQVEASQKKYKKAWEYQFLHDQVSDSVINMESAKQMADFQAKYETEKKENQIDLLEKEKEIQRLEIQKSETQKIYLIVVAFLLLALSIIILNRFKLKKRTAQKLALLNATKDKFFAIIAHDLKNPVSAFNHIAQQVNTHLESLSAEELKYYISQLSDTSSSLLSLLKNLLEWSRSQRGQVHADFKKINPVEIINSTIQEAKYLEKNRNMDIHAETDSTDNILSDSYILNTILRNLIGNALKYSPDGSKIKVTGSANHSEYIISVADNGPGLSQEDIKKLFRIEVDTKTIGNSENKGTGIGLIICYEFLKKIKGRIWAESKPGKGCVFSIAVPLLINSKSNHKT